MPPWAVSPWPLADTTPDVVVHGAVPDSNPPLDTMSPVEEPPPPTGLTVQVNVVEPVAVEVFFAVTVTEEVPAVVGVPEIRPLEALIDSPAGRPVALLVSVWSFGSLAWICTVGTAATLQIQ